VKNRRRGEEKDRRGKREKRRGKEGRDDGDGGVRREALPLVRGI